MSQPPTSIPNSPLTGSSGSPEETYRFGPSHTARDEALSSARDSISLRILIPGNVVALETSGFLTLKIPRSKSHTTTIAKLKKQCLASLTRKVNRNEITPGSSNKVVTEAKQYDRKQYALSRLSTTNEQTEVMDEDTILDTLPDWETMSLMLLRVETEEEYYTKMRPQQLQLTNSNPTYSPLTSPEYSMRSSAQSAFPLPTPTGKSTPADFASSFPSISANGSLINSSTSLNVCINCQNSGYLRASLVSPTIDVGPISISSNWSCFDGLQPVGQTGSITYKFFQNLHTKEWLSWKRLPSDPNKFSIGLTTECTNESRWVIVKGKIQYLEIPVPPSPNQPLSRYYLALSPNNQSVISCSVLTPVGSATNRPKPPLAAQLKICFGVCQGIMSRKRHDWSLDLSIGPEALAELNGLTTTLPTIPTTYLPRFFVLTGPSFSYWRFPRELMGGLSGSENFDHVDNQVLQSIEQLTANQVPLCTINVNAIRSVTVLHQPSLGEFTSHHGQQLPPQTHRRHSSSYIRLEYEVPSAISNRLDQMVLEIPSSIYHASYEQIDMWLEAFQQKGIAIIWEDQLEEKEAFKRKVGLLTSKGISLDVLRSTNIPQKVSSATPVDQYDHDDEIDVSQAERDQVEQQFLMLHASSPSYRQLEELITARRTTRQQPQATSISLPLSYQAQPAHQNQFSPSLLPSSQHSARNSDGSHVSDEEAFRRVEELLARYSTPYHSHRQLAAVASELLGKSAAGVVSPTSPLRFHPSQPQSHRDAMVNSKSPPSSGGLSGSKSPLSPPSFSLKQASATQSPQMAPLDVGAGYGQDPSSLQPSAVTSPALHPLGSGKSAEGSVYEQSYGNSPSFEPTPRLDSSRKQPQKPQLRLSQPSSQRGEQHFDPADEAAYAQLHGAISPHRFHEFNPSKLAARIEEELYTNRPLQLASSRTSSRLYHVHEHERHATDEEGLESEEIREEMTQVQPLTEATNGLNAFEEKTQTPPKSAVHSIHSSHRSPGRSPIRSPTLTPARRLSSSSRASSSKTPLMARSPHSGPIQDVLGGNAASFREKLVTPREFETNENEDETHENLTESFDTQRTGRSVKQQEQGHDSHGLRDGTNRSTKSQEQPHASSSHDSPLVRESTNRSMRSQDHIHQPLSEEVKYDSPYSNESYQVEQSQPTHNATGRSMRGNEELPTSQFNDSRRGTSRSTKTTEDQVRDSHRVRDSSGRVATSQDQSRSRQVQSTRDDNKAASTVDRVRVLEICLGTVSEPVQYINASIEAALDASSNPSISTTILCSVGAISPNSNWILCDSLISPMVKSLRHSFLRSATGEPLFLISDEHGRVSMASELELVRAQQSHGGGNFHPQLWNVVPNPDHQQFSAYSNPHLFLHVNPSTNALSTVNLDDMPSASADTFFRICFAVVQGYLKKLSKKNAPVASTDKKTNQQPWLKRYCVLSGLTFSYFKSTSDANHDKPVGVYQLEEIEYVYAEQTEQISSTTGKPKSPRFALQLYSGKVIHFKCDSMANCLQWTEALVRKGIQLHPGPVPSSPVNEDLTQSGDAPTESDSTTASLTSSESLNQALQSTPSGMKELQAPTSARTRALVAQWEDHAAANSNLLLRPAEYDPSAAEERERELREEADAIARTNEERMNGGTFQIPVGESKEEVEAKEQDHNQTNGSSDSSSTTTTIERPSKLASSPIVVPFLHVCCISSLSDAALAIDSGATGLSFMVHKAQGHFSRLSPSQIKQIVSEVPNHISTILQTEKTEALEILEQQAATGVNTVQLLEPLSSDAEYEVLRFKLALLPRMKMIQVIQVLNDSTIDIAIRAAGLVDTIVLKCHSTPKLALFDWKICRRIHDAINEAFPKEKKRIILSGGLHGGNVKQAMEMVGAHGLELCDGIHTQTVLDGGKLKTLAQTVGQDGPIPLPPSLESIRALVAAPKPMVINSPPPKKKKEPIVAVPKIMHICLMSDQPLPTTPLSPRSMPLNGYLLSHDLLNHPSNISGVSLSVDLSEFTTWTCSDSSVSTPINSDATKLFQDYKGEYLSCSNEGRLDLTPTATHESHWKLHKKKNCQLLESYAYPNWFLASDPTTQQIFIHDLTATTKSAEAEAAMQQAMTYWQVDDTTSTTSSVPRPIQDEWPQLRWKTCFAIIQGELLKRGNIVSPRPSTMLPLSPNEPASITSFVTRYFWVSPEGLSYWRTASEVHPLPPLRNYPYESILNVLVDPNHPTRFDLVILDTGERVELKTELPWQKEMWVQALANKGVKVFPHVGAIQS